MSFQRKLLAVFSLTVFLSVAAVTAIVSSVTRRAFERSDEERAAALVAQFRREFNRRGEEVVRDISAIAAGEAATHMVLALNREAPDYGTFLSVAKNIATDQQLDFLEFASAEGTILSSAQWPGKFGYKEPSFAGKAPANAFLRQEELPDGAALGLSAIREIKVGDKSLYVIGGRRLDKEFLAGLELPEGSRAMLYQNLGSGFSPQLLLVPSGTIPRPALLAPLILQVQQQRQEVGDVIHWTSDALDDETVHAIPLDGQDERLLGILLVGNSRRPYIGLQRHIRIAAVLAATAGILLAILFSGWAAGRVTQPVQQLAEAAREVAQGNWNAQVPVTSSDELGQLAEAFNRMTSELTEQRERLVQSERVAAWRELARRLAHELKNPLFPLQLTVENLVRARGQSPEQFEEVFRESSSTLLAEIANLKTIVSRFSEFSKMPQPHFQRVELNEVVRNVFRLFQAQLQLPENSRIACRLELADPMDAMVADPELLHRALLNLMLNAMDAMPSGGVLTLRTRQAGERAVVEVCDTGAGLGAEDCEHLFTPYYTSKTHGTGLGLAIVQSVVSDHGGKIGVQSQPGRGTTFAIELPRNLDKLPTAGQEDILSKATP
jgi:two-component system, NtrC family, nitrogen regulation sensor histidine kinase NtrY